MVRRSEQEKMEQLCPNFSFERPLEARRWIWPGQLYRETPICTHHLKGLCMRADAVGVDMQCRFSHSIWHLYKYSRAERMTIEKIGRLR